MSRIIGVVSGKGGVGKTTVVANLGAVLAERFAKRVVIVDCNLTTSHLSMYLGLHQAPTTINDVLRGEAEISEAAYIHESGMTVVPASLSSGEGGEFEIGRLKNVVGKLFGGADVVLLDSAPGLGKEAMATIGASDEVLFVTNPNTPAVMDVIRCSKAAGRTGVRKLGIVLNMVHGESHELSVREVEQLAELKVIAIVPFDKNVMRSLDARKPVITYNPNSGASRAFVRLASHLVSEAGPRHRAGLLHRILKFFRVAK